MPDFTPYTRQDLNRVLSLIAKSVYTIIGDLEINAWHSREPLPFEQRQDGKELHLAIGDKWGDLFDCAWFHFTGKIPPEAAGKPVVLLLDVNGEMCVVDRKGVPLRGLTNVSSDYDFSLGTAGKHVLPITSVAKGGETIDVWADAGCNDLFGNLRDNGTVREACIAVCHETVRALFYDFEVLLDFLKVLPEDSVRYQQILVALNDARWTLAGGCNDETAQTARELLRPMLEKHGGDPSLTISAIGHSHIDLGWLWPIRETHRKGARTFATVLANMDLYPDYIFGASQAQLFEWIKEDHPALYEKVKRRVQEGRFEPQGCMWVEADTNITGGEALVRQILHGKRFFKQEFGVDIHYLWLPDVFGYSAALPQILQKAGVDTFMTQKLSWNQVNKFPHHSFHWQGIDGTRILAHMLPEETYNSPALPRSIVKIEKNYAERGISDGSLMLFGIGDGGGGPGEEHLERLGRIGNLAGLSPVKQEWAAAFFKLWAKDADRFPVWVGELYFERHAGTLTTEAKNKWYNRRTEQALRQLEWTAILAGKEYPAERLENIWREVLLYQFHDILPGSSIKRVYDESLERYQALYTEIEVLTHRCEESLARTVDTRGMKSPLVVFNSLSWERTEWLEADGKWKQVTVPALGYSVVDMSVENSTPAGHHFPPLTATTGCLENDVLRVEFAPDGSIVSVYDKELGGEVLPAGQVANRLAVYHDVGGDAWDFLLDYASQSPRYMELVSAEARLEGPRAVLEQVYRIGHSELVQEIVLAAGSRRLDFNTRLHWRETETMLRTSFPVAVHAEEAAYEIQFGHIRRPTHRNTTWDLAKDEAAVHKWADLSQRDCGAAVLNDSKYGCKIKGNVIDLDLLRSVPYPGPRLVKDSDVKPGEAHHGYTDQADHMFRYAFYPHRGDLVEGGVVQAGYEFNIPLRGISARAHAGARPASNSLLQVSAPNIVVEAVKKAEDDEGIVVRLYESAHAGTHATLRFGCPLKKAEETNLMEEAIRPLKLKQGSLELDFQPFEIKTIKLTV